MFRIKICGITTRQDASVVVEAGADALGFNFYPRSPRYIPPREASQIAKSLPRGVAKVGVFVNSPVGEIREIAFRVTLDWIQLHGDETPDILRQLRPLVCIKAFRVDEETGLGPVKQFLEACVKQDVMPRAILLDSRKDDAYGGTGSTFDWKLAKEYAKLVSNPPPLILSGGLTPENVEEAILTVNPAAVDVASGVEESPGKKSAEKVLRFVQQAKAAWQKLAS
ncbi:Phosphoribosylanthranilate isomerase [Thermogutta terrifontis]|uniref:N-(5'-phosphoribosyl)anthranilate isomerase n=1 Tax=Thermogutta terrifontis TaxID=1331910 RepID=A0A286RHC2_9BACT|nr:phosphoribosylanthranilate isomerase [Thermogutta terrifontis]ASV75375.1 Phosphoribosylanthranilate isomerase [Thermogutta terrifontis]